MNVLKDLYEILGIERTASQEEIKRKYRLLAKKYHPDLNQGDEKSERIFKEINLAYEVLGDADKRKQYDTYGDAIFEGGGGSGAYGGFGDFFSDLFSGMGFGGFGGFGGQSRPRGPRNGGDIQVDIPLNFKEAVFGVEKEVSFHRMERCNRCDGSGAEPGHDKKTCPECNGTGRKRSVKRTPFGQFVSEESCYHCRGTGEIIEEKCHTCHGEGFVKAKKKIKINIPAGVDDGSIMTLRGEGNHGERGGHSGDLYVVMRVADHPLFHRDGQTIYFDLPITVTQAALGATLEVPTLRGVKNYDLPAGTQTGTTFVMKGEGVKSVRQDQMGDLIFRVIVETPTKLSKRQEELLEEFARESGEELKKKKKNFLEKVKDFITDEIL